MNLDARKRAVIEKIDNIFKNAESPISMNINIDMAVDRASTVKYNVEEYLLPCKDDRSKGE